MWTLRDIVASGAILIVISLFPTVAAADTNPPYVIVYPPNPSMIPNDGSVYAELRVDVYDDTAVDRVTVDLTPIGGEIVNMICIGNYTTETGIVSMFNYTTNATCPPGTYKLVVNATDATQEMNYNNTAAITLKVSQAQRPTVIISDGEVSIGGEVEIEIMLDGAPEGLSGYNMTIYLEDPDVAEIVSVEFPEWATLKDNSTLPADSFWMKAVDLNDNVKKGASNISLGKIIIRGDKQGETKINATISKMDDDEGSKINPSVDPGILKIHSVIPLPDHENPPTDPDNDGLYEDINGNGLIDFADVVDFFEYLEWIEKNEPTNCFDFNNNGLIDFADVVILFEEV